MRKDTSNSAEILLAIVNMDVRNDLPNPVINSMIGHELVT
jgi:hypothetical protein